MFYYCEVVKIWEKAKVEFLHKQVPFLTLLKTVNINVFVIVFEVVEIWEKAGAKFCQANHP